MTDSPFVLAKIRQPISLLACHINNPRAGIDEEMTSMLMHYSEPLQGVILSFRNVKLQQSLGYIMNEQPYIHCHVVAEAMVFQPRAGMILDAVVNKIGSNHIGMLFAGVFNGSVAASELPNGYVHNYAKDSWIGAKGDTIAVNDTVKVQVKRVHVAGGIIAVEASMKALDRSTTKSSSAAARRRSIDLIEQDTKKTEKKKKKRKHVEEEPVKEKKEKKRKQK